MNKQEFIANLRESLRGLPRQDVEEHLSFYSEMIDDRTEEGLSEEDAVAQIGSVDAIAQEILAEIPLSRIAKERIKPKKQLRAWEIVLLVLGSPIWLSLAVAAFAVVLSLYVVLWSVIISLWAIFASLIGCSLGFIAAAIIFVMTGNGLTGAAMIGASLFCAGLAILLFFGCKAATRGILLLTKKLALGIKKCFVGKEAA